MMGKQNVRKRSDSIVRNVYSGKITSSTLGEVDRALWTTTSTRSTSCTCTCCTCASFTCTSCMCFVSHDAGTIIFELWLSFRYIYIYIYAMHYSSLAPQSDTMQEAGNNPDTYAE